MSTFKQNIIKTSYKKKKTFIYINHIHTHIYIYIIHTQYIYIEVIFHARKSVLYNDGKPWVKKEVGCVDVTMGAYDGAGVCELIGIYMLYLIGKKCDSKNIGLYRDNGPAVLKNVSGPALEKLKNIYNRCSNKKACK